MRRILLIAVGGWACGNAPPEPAPAPVEPAPVAAEHAPVAEPAPAPAPVSTASPVVLAWPWKSRTEAELLLVTLPSEQDRTVAEGCAGSIVLEPSGLRAICSTLGTDWIVASLPSGPPQVLPERRPIASESDLDFAADGTVLDLRSSGQAYALVDSAWVESSARSGVGVRLEQPVAVGTGGTAVTDEALSAELARISGSYPRDWFVDSSPPRFAYQVREHKLGPNVNAMLLNAGAGWAPVKQDGIWTNLWVRGDWALVWNADDARLYDLTTGTQAWVGNRHATFWPETVPLPGGG